MPGVGRFEIEDLGGWGALALTMTIDAHGPKVLPAAGAMIVADDSDS